jgi:hypothetical protein
MAWSDAAQRAASDAHYRAHLNSLRKEPQSHLDHQTTRENLACRLREARAQGLKGRLAVHQEAFRWIGNAGPLLKSVGAKTGNLPKIVMGDPRSTSLTIEKHAAIAAKRFIARVVQGRK